jgi:DNA mismatch repair protein MSH4
VDHLISSFIQAPRRHGIKSTEQSINCVINLKHLLSKVVVIREHISYGSCAILKAIHNVKF